MSQKNALSALGNVPMERSRENRGKTVITKTILVVFVNLFIISCAFDPADLLFKLKVPLFCACWLLFGLFYLYNPRRYKVPIGLVAYVAAMIAIPAWSIGYYLATNGRQPFEGFALLKAYVLVSLALLLYLNKLDVLKPICVVLTMLSAVIVAVAVLLRMHPALFEPIAFFGDRYGIIRMDNRNYGSGLTLLMVFFTTSPMLVLPIAYYMHRMIASSGFRKLFNGGVALLNIIAMFVAGTRNNMLSAILLPIALLMLHRRTGTRIFIITCASVVVILGVSYYWDEILILFSAEEKGNFIRLGYLPDYRALFSDPMTLLFGQGLGAYHYWTPIGREYYLTELTYLDIIRFFGLFLGTIMMALMSYPLYYAFVANPRFSQKHIVVAYGFYLAGCITQPQFFSSMGMLILAIVVANIFMDSNRRHKAVSANGSAGMI